MKVCNDKFIYNFTIWHVFALFDKGTFGELAFISKTNFKLNRILVNDVENNEGNKPSEDDKFYKAFPVRSTMNMIMGKYSIIQNALLLVHLAVCS